MSSGKDIYEERPYINSIGISLYALLLLLLIAHYIKRRIVNKIRSSGLCLFFYLSMALFLTMRILWLVSDFYYILPYKTEDGTIVYSKTIGSRLHFIFNRVSSALYLIIYISISIAWMNATLSLVSSGAAQNAVNIEYDFESLPLPLRVILVLISLIVVLFTAAVVTVGLTLNETIVFKSHTVRGIDDVVSSNQRNEEDAVGICSTPFSSTPLLAFNSTLNAIVYLLFVFTLTLCGAGLYRHTRHRVELSHTQRALILAVPVLCDGCFAAHALALELSFFAVNCSHAAFVVAGIFIPELIPSLLFILTMPTKYPYFFFIGEVFRLPEKGYDYNSGAYGTFVADAAEWTPRGGSGVIPYEGTYPESADLLSYKYH